MAGLVETGMQRRVGRTEAVAAALVAILLIISATLITPLASSPGIESTGFLSGFAGVTMMTNLVLAVVLFSRGVIARIAAPIRLGSAYLFAAMMVVAQLFTFPDALVHGVIIGASGSAVWLWTFWHGGFAIAIARYAWGDRDEPVRRAMVRSILVVMGIVLMLTILATQGLSYLPDLLSGKTYFTSGPTRGVPIAVLTLSVIAFGLVLRRRLRTPQDLWLSVGMLSACIDVWLTYHAGARFSVGWYAGRVAAMLTSIVVLVSLFRDITLLYSHVVSVNAQLAEMARLDGLTALANRRSLDAVLATEWRRAQRDRRTLAFVLVDVDHFKRFNDRYGHLQGDECLRIVADRLRSVARRPGDLAARYGGEEFALVLPSTDEAGALRLATELRQAVRDQAIPHEASPLEFVTISVGVASATPGPNEGFSGLVARADAALYHAKETGRDRVCVIDAVRLEEAA